MSANDDGDSPPSLSEVASVLDKNKETNVWSAMFEQQNKNMRALIEALLSPKPAYCEELPAFDPDTQGTDARSWCATADLCFSENPPRGGRLVLAVSKALKGEASTWLSQIAYEGMTWDEFKVLFTTRFISTETLAGTLIKMNGEKPSDKETLPAFASRLITSLTNRWKNVNKEEIAVATVLAHISQFDPRLQRMAFTTSIGSRDKLQQELNAFSYLKRKINPTGESSNITDVKRAKTTSIKCFNCGKTGHKRIECRSKPMDTRTPTSSSSEVAQQPASKPLVCFKCGKPGHIAVRCTSSGGSGGGSSGSADGGARRVDVCVVHQPSGTLQHKGELIRFTYDSGAECSLVKESFASKFIGKRVINAVAMIGIGQTRVFSTEQILCCVVINDHPLEILLHVLPDNYLQSDVMLGREILNQGFAVNMTSTELTLKKVLCVNSIRHNSDDASQSDLAFIATDVTGNNKIRLLQTLNKFSEFFITGLPTTRVNTGQLKIKLIDPNRTVQRRPYRMSVDERRVVRDARRCERALRSEYYQT